MTATRSHFTLSLSFCVDVYPNASHGTATHSHFTLYICIFTSISDKDGTKTGYQFVSNFYLIASMDKARYCKVPKFSDARKLCYNQPKIHSKRHNIIVKALIRLLLIWVCTVCPDLPFRKLRIMSFMNYNKKYLIFQTPKTFL